MNSLHRTMKLNIQMKSRAAAFAFCMLAVLIVAASVPSQAQVPTPTIVYGFQQATTDAAAPWGALAQGRDGNLYGTGTARAANFTGGVFKITPAGVETLLASFPTNWNQCEGLTLATDGNFYGGCVLGGANNLGLIYRVTPTGVLTDIHDFTSGGQGANPIEAPVLGADGALYGTTSGDQTIYRITTAGVFKVLYAFSGGNSVPSMLTAGSDGSFYGTEGTAAGFGNTGGVFKITPAGVFTLLFGFDGTSPVRYPNNPVLRATNGKFYGTTGFPSGNATNGTIYSLTTAGVVTDLFDWQASSNLDAGVNPMLQASNGNFYGASPGGAVGNMGGLFELTAANAYSSFLFTDETTYGGAPGTPLMQHTSGLLYGTNSAGGPNFAEGILFSANIKASPFISLVTPVPAGKEGAKVGILGQGFKPTSVVKFGGTVVATKTVTGTTFIMATVPAGALTGKVTVTTGTATVSSLANYRVTPTITSFTPASGPVGTSVVITGTGLKQATKVTLNTVSATFTVNSDTQITASVPAGATTGKIAVTTTGGTATSATSFTVN